VASSMTGVCAWLTRGAERISNRAADVMSNWQRFIASSDSCFVRLGLERHPFCPKRGWEVFNSFELFLKADMDLDQPAG
jgi:hypothetical protein